MAPKLRFYRNWTKSYEFQKHFQGFVILTKFWRSFGYLEITRQRPWKLVLPCGSWGHLPRRLGVVPEDGSRRFFVLFSMNRRFWAWGVSKFGASTVLFMLKWHAHLHQSEGAGLLISYNVVSGFWTLVPADGPKMLENRGFFSRKKRCAFSAIHAPYWQKSNKSLNMMWMHWKI